MFETALKHQHYPLVNENEYELGLAKIWGGTSVREIRLTPGND